MIIKEFQVVLPLSVEKYQIGQLYVVAEASKAETGGGDGVEVLKNEPFTDHKEFGSGQYTYKIYHLEQKVPAWIKAIAPTGSLHLHEEAWNAYPYCKTVLTNPDYMKDYFKLSITTWHKPGNKDLPNVHNLSGKQLDAREIVPIDIANDYVKSSDYKKEYDPLLHGLFAGKDADGKTWIDKADPVMTCYKLVEIEFRWRVIGGKVESFIGDAERRLFTNIHRQIYCTHGKWGDMTMEDIRRIEDQTKSELDQQRTTGAVQGSSAE